MSIYKKNSVLCARNLRQLNNFTAHMQDGTAGKINYPYVVLKVEGRYRPVNIEVEKNFKNISSIKNGHTVVALRQSEFSDLLTTGRGIPLRSKHHL